MALFEYVWSFISTTIFSKSILFILMGIFGAGFIVAFHEFGHLIFCKLFNIKAPSFSIGMGPRLISKKVGATEYSVSAIPLGGYVEIAHKPEDDTSSDSTGSYFESKPYWQKMLVISGGIMFNMIFAYLIFTLLYLTGMPNSPIAYPENAIPVINSIMKDSPAQKAKLQIGDKIVAINGDPLNNNIKALFSSIEPLANKKVRFSVERNGKTFDRTILLGQNPFQKKPVGYLGVGFETKALKPQPLWKSIKQGVNRTNFILIATLKSFKNMLTRRNIDGLGGPIMIISQTIKHAERGIKIFFAFLALISVNLAILNVIPLPILDGGQALFTTIEAAIRRPLPTRIREYLAVGTWIIFLVLTLYLSFRDIKILRALRNNQVSTQQKDS